MRKVFIFFVKAENGNTSEHAESFYQENEENHPFIGSTQVHLLGKIIFDACQEKILEAIAFANI